MPGLSPVVASTETEALRYASELDELGNQEIGLKRLSGVFGGFDLSNLGMDTPLAPEDFPDPQRLQGSTSRPSLIIDLVRNQKPTLRELLAKLSAARGHYTFAGTPEQVADLMEDWINDGAADGFNLMPPVLPKMLDVFIEQVVPELRRRGIFRSSYQGNTLRDHYSLHTPPSHFD